MESADAIVAKLPPSDPSDEVTRPSASAGSVKETLESILVAFILAFIFRAFIVEAFVIPTGSMAPTLMGAHTRMHCPDCAYNFDVNFSAPGQGDDVVIPSTAGKITSPVYCPNCGYQVDPSQTDNPPVYYGDRILVLKYQYLFNPPRRWDVVVFKAPVEPEKNNYGQNYIKRLTGRPGEAVMVLDGDVYIREPNAKNPRDFTVQTKPKYAQDALWRIVYDNDYHPQQRLDRGAVKPFTLPWKIDSGSGWKLDDPIHHGRIMPFDNSTGESTISFNPNANPTGQTLSDYLVYDSIPDYLSSRNPNDPFPNRREVPVSDLDLRLTYERLAGDGELALTMTKRDHRFTAVLSPTEAKLFQTVGETRRQIGSTVLLAKSSTPVRVELSNADYQVTLRIDDKIVVQSTPADYAPDMVSLLHEYDLMRANTTIRPPAAQVSISADHQTGQISHVSLFRDVYYYNGVPMNGVAWATPHDFPNKVQQLGNDEYFVMGDNSLVSYDARCWTSPGVPPIDLPDENLQTESGRIPGRFLLGKAFFVYWPAGYEPVSGWPALIPNFGDMRFIH